MYSLIYNLRIGEKDIEEKLLITDSCVLVFLGEKISIYIKKYDAIYIVNAEAMTLSPIDLSNFQKQNEILSKRIGFLNNIEEINPENIFEFESRFYKCFNDNKAFNSVIKTIRSIDFRTTAYSDYFNFNMKNQSMKISINKDEFLAYNKTELNFTEIKQHVEKQLVSIEKFKIPQGLLKIENYRITENERNLY